eukprot:3513776-Pleurochrysis_carterae.AAC.2
MALESSNYDVEAISSLPVLGRAGLNLKLLNNMHTQIFVFRIAGFITVASPAAQHAGQLTGKINPNLSGL